MASLDHITIFKKISHFYYFLSHVQLHRGPNFVTVNNL